MGASFAGRDDGRALTPSAAQSLLAAQPRVGGGKATYRNGEVAESRQGGRCRLPGRRPNRLVFGGAASLVRRRFRRRHISIGRCAAKEPIHMNASIASSPPHGYRDGFRGVDR
jgi:hypothetical protein